MLNGNSTQLLARNQHTSSRKPEVRPMAYRVSCPHCMSLLSVPRKLSGKVVVCPCCKEKCRVPLPSTVALPPAAKVEGDVPAADGRIRPYDPSHGTWMRTALIASVAAAILAVGALLLNTALQTNRPVRVPTANAGEDSGTPGGNGDAPADAPSSEALAQQAEQVLRTHCYRCHGQDGIAEGGFNFVLRRERLVADGQYIAPGKPDDSYLLARIVDEEMPPSGEQRPSPQEIDTLRRWIAAGAPDFAAPLNRPFLSNADLVRFLREDLEKNVPPREYQFTRYFTLVNLFNAGYSDDEMESYRLALTKLINSLSWHRDIIKPVAVDPHRTVYRIDIREPGWNASIWQAIVEANPYSVRLNEEEQDGQFCAKATGCEVPHVRADWFVAAASKPPLYHTVLQVPATLEELLAARFLGMDLQKDVQQETVVRVGFNRSGVSSHNRLLEWHHSPFGHFWISYDFAADTGRKNLFRHPLGPGDDEDHFQHDGGEIIFSLPNGLQGYMLIDAEGRRIDKGPTEIVRDDRRPDGAVTNGVSCMSCHYAGIIPKADEIRPTVEANFVSYKDNAEQIKALYPPQKEIDSLFEEGTRQFRKAMQEVGLEQLTSTGEPVVNMALRFEADVDARTAASELGLKLEDFLGRIKGNPSVLGRLGPLNVAGGTVKRDVFAKDFAFVVEQLGLGEALALPSAESPEKTAKTEEPAAPKQEAGNSDPTPPAAPPLRVWSDVKNNIAIEAQFVKLVEDKAELRKADGTVVLIPLLDLSPADRIFIEKQLPAVPQTSQPPEEKPPLSPLPPQQPPQIAPEPPRVPQRVKIPQGRPILPVLEFRDWYNEAIRMKIPAAFVSLVHGDLKLQRQDLKGVIITWPMQDMRPADHEYVKQLVGEDHYKAHKDLPPGKRPY